MHVWFPPGSAVFAAAQERRKPADRQATHPYHSRGSSVAQGWSRDAHFRRGVEGSVLSRRGTNLAPRRPGGLTMKLMGVALSLLIPVVCVSTVGAQKNETESK